MTFGLSKTVAEFLIAAARKRKFDVIVAQSAPSYTGSTYLSITRALCAVCAVCAVERVRCVRLSVCGRE